MIEVRIVSFVLDPRTNQPVIILKPIADESGPGRLLPIWIGQQEATAIILAFEGTQPPRPLVYDLMKSLLDAVDAAVERVEVTRIEEGTFYAAITLRTAKGIEVIDSRPSDSIALAIRVGAPIYVAEDVLDEAAMVEEESEDTADKEAEVAAFREFLDAVNPEDFQG